MNAWIWSGWVAVLIGGFAFVLCFVPILAWQYRKFGRPSPARVIGAAAASIYAMAVVSYTMLPLPQTYPGWCSAIADKTPQLVPFHFIDVIAAETAGTGPLSILRNFYALQVLFNVLLFIPWGVIARRYFSWGILSATLSGFLASLFIELTQYTGIWGIYECAYRLADVDDLMMNTAGALIGALIAPLLLWWMPRRSELATRRNLPHRVTSWRRWFGMFLDYVLFVVVGYLASAGISLSLWLSFGVKPNELATPVLAIGAVIGGLAVFYLPALFGLGASLGQRIVWLSPSWPQVSTQRRSVWRRLWRATVVGGLLTVATVLSTFRPDALGTLLVQGAVFLVVVFSLITVPFSRGKRGLSFTLSGAELVDSRAVVKETDSERDPTT